jgi:hypothetical protein
MIYDLWRYEMFFQNDSVLWSKEVFGGCELGDPRRKRRLLDLSTRLADDPSGSISRVCKDDSAAREGSYKLIENRAVRPEEIFEGVYLHTVQQAKSCKLVLAVQDTTTVSFSHSIGEDLRENGSAAGFQVHSTLLIDGESKEPIGLIDQNRWLREPKEKRPGKDARRNRTFENKESFKWAAAFQETKNRLKDMSKVVTVCDREADIFDFLQMQLRDNCRFVVRLTRDRALQDQAGYLFEAIKKFPKLGERKVRISQRGAQKASGSQSARPARKKRIAATQLAVGTITLKVPRHGLSKNLEPIVINIVSVRETRAPKDETPISWMLLTTEPVSTLEQANKVVDIYACRWLVEEFHKVWKTGCKIEERRLQTLENVERMMAITAPIAVRIFQLKSLGEERPERPCSIVLSVTEWQYLWMIIEKTKCPSTPPSSRWAYRSLGKLAGWSDSKRTGRVGWQTLWLGWEKLHNQLLGWQAAMETMEIDREPIH